MNCENCAYYAFDEETEEYVCSAYMDEDEYAAFLTSGMKKCPQFRLDDEYGVVRRQN
jgi:hypothetical protein